MEIDLHINGQLIFNKDTKLVKGKKTFWLTVLEQVSTL